MDHGLLEWLRAFLAAFFVWFVQEAVKAVRRLNRRPGTQEPKATPVFITPTAQASSGASAHVTVPAMLRFAPPAMKEESLSTDSLSRGFAPRAMKEESLSTDSLSR